MTEDIQTLNEWALEGRLEVTAISLATYPLVQDRYVLLPHGASIGSGYGPIVVAREPLTLDELQREEIVVPGTLTTAYLVLRMALGRDVATRALPFDEILDEVAVGPRRAGLLIHEGQLTYARHGAREVPRPRRVVVARDRAAAAARRQHGPPRPRRRATARRLRGAARVDRRRARRTARGARVRARLRPRPRRRARRPLHRHVRERAHARLRRRRAAPRSGSCCGAPRASAPTRAPFGLNSPSEPRGRPLRPCGRRSAATAARSPASARTTSPRSSIREAVDAGRRAGRRRSRTSGSAPPTSRARTTATSPGWPRCSPACRTRCAGVTVNRLCASGLAAVVGRLSRGDRGRRRPLRRRRRRVDEPRAVRDAEARQAVPARRPAALRHDARLALRQPEARGALPARGDGRDRRERRRALGRLARGPGRVRVRVAAALGRRRRGRALRRRARSRRRDDARRASASRHLAREARHAPARLPRGRHGHRRATRPGSTTARPRS